MQRAVDTVMQAFGRIDVLVNNLGDAIRKPLVALPGGRMLRLPCLMMNSHSSWISI